MSRQMSRQMSGAHLPMRGPSFVRPSALPTHGSWTALRADLMLFRQGKACGRPTGGGANGLDLAGAPMRFGTGLPGARVFVGGSPGGSSPRMGSLGGSAPRMCGLAGAAVRFGTALPGARVFVGGSPGGSSPRMGSPGGSAPRMWDQRLA
jgi:hypothetical protein